MKPVISGLERAFRLYEMEQKIKAMEQKVSNKLSDDAFLLMLVGVESKCFGGKLTEGTQKRLEAR